MKTILTTFTLFLLSINCFGQNYQPFNQTSSKRFFLSGDPSNNDYFFHVDSTNIVGDSIIYSQYHPIQNTGPQGSNPNGCSFWGGTTGEVLTTSWLGNQVKWNSISNELTVENELNEPLAFDFDLPLGNSAPFYSNGVTIFLIEHSSAVLESFLGISDSVKVFTISATDNVGTPISSPLNGYEIKLSKNYGLISFINIYDFPSIQERYELQGQTNPYLGSYQLSYDDCYPWQSGDVLQYSNYHTLGISGPPPYSAYQTITVTDRIETIDSVKLYFSSVSQQLNPGTPTPSYNRSSAPILYKKGTPISEIPWNKSQSIYQLVSAVEDSTDHCGYHTTFKTQELFSVFCDSCQCYGSFDGFGQTIENVEFMQNYGLSRISFISYGPISSTPNGSSSLIYSNVNGVECGTLWNDLDEIPQFDLSASPNPTSDKLEIKSDQNLDEVRVIDLTGRLILKLENISQKTTEISLASFQKGAYILEVTANNSIQTRTIIKE